jgi:hypothetical protein
MISEQSKLSELINGLLHTILLNFSILKIKIYL